MISSTSAQIQQHPKEKPLGDEESSQAAEEWQVYNEAFKSGGDRKTQIGPCFQVSETDIPPIPSLIQERDQRLV